MKRHGATIAIGSRARTGEVAFEGQGHTPPRLHPGHLRPQAVSLEIPTELPAIPTGMDFA